MRDGVSRLRAGMSAVFLACSLFVSFGFAQSRHQREPSQRDSLKRFLRDYLSDPADENDMTTRYSDAWVDLKENGTYEVIVYVTGKEWCGSGGCRMLVLAAEGTSFQVVTATTITRLPIRVLATKSNGWHDISVFVQGGGIQPGYEAKLSFDGKTYPSNPTVLPAREVVGMVAGLVLVPVSAKGKPVY